MVSRLYIMRVLPGPGHVTYSCAITAYHANVVNMQVDRSSYFRPSNILCIQIPETTFLWVIHYTMSFFSVYLSTSEFFKYIRLQSPSPPLISLCTTILLLAFRADISSGDKIWMFPPLYFDSTPSSTVYLLYRFQAH